MSRGIRWAFNVKEWSPTKAQWKLCLKCIQKEEKDRCNRFHFVDDCKSSMCLKESYVKAVGTGIAFDLQSISFSCKTSLKCGEVTTDTKLYKDKILQKEWRFEESFLDADHCVAVAVQINKATGSPNKAYNYCPKRFEELKYEELMKNSVPFEEVDEKFWEDFTSKSKKSKVPVKDATEVL